MSSLKISLSSLIIAILVAVIIGLWQGEIPRVSVEYSLVDVSVKDSPDEPRAFAYEFNIPPNRSITYDSIKELENNLFKIGEKVFLYLSNYSLTGLEGWSKNGDEYVFVIHLIRGGKDKALVIHPRRKMEVYASIKKDGEIILTPLFRVLDPQDSAEIIGDVSIKNASSVLLYLFMEKKSLNTTDDLRNESLIANLTLSKRGSFRVRLDPALLTPPFRVEEGPYVLVYANMCEGGYRWFSLNELRGKTIKIALKCNLTGTG